jgi:hypothetical protein
MFNKKINQQNYIIYNITTQRKYCIRYYFHEAIVSITRWQNYGVRAEIIPPLPPSRIKSLLLFTNTIPKIIINNKSINTR